MSGESPIRPKRLAVSPPVEVAAAAQQGIEALAQARAKLTALLGAPYDAVITTSSGTGAFEGALVSLTPERGKVVNAQAGKFSERWGEMSGRLGYDTTVVARPWGEVLDPDEVAEDLAALSGYQGPSWTLRELRLVRSQALLGRERASQTRQAGQSAGSEA